MAAMLVNRVEPQYPAIAKAAHISGTVHLRAIIAKGWHRARTRSGGRKSAACASRTACRAELGVTGQLG